MLNLQPPDFVDAPWYLVLARPNQNHIACRQLLQRGFDVFMPRHRTARRSGGRVVTEVRPIFSGYLFLGVNPAVPRWREIRMTPGVSRLVSFGSGGPAPIPTAIVTGLMLRCDPDGCLLPEQDWQIGDQVRIASGPFLDFVSTIDAVEPDRRIHVLLDIMGRSTRITLDAATVTRQG